MREDQMGDCRSLGSNYFPGSQSRKISIGVMVEEPPNLQSGACKEGADSMPDKRASCSGTKLVEIQGKGSELMFSSQGKQAQVPGKDTSPWICTKSLRQEVMMTKNDNFSAKQKNKSNGITETPLVHWITGGPGCSAFSGLILEIGPLYFKKVIYNGSLPTFVLNPNSWTKVSNIIFLDVPVGTGFSYSRSLQGSYDNDVKTARQASNFIKKWLVNHPEFISNPFYIGGDSYSGIVIPAIVQHLSDDTEAGVEPLINLTGYLLGNPVTDRHLEENSQIPYAHNMAIISDELYESVKKNCKEEYYNVDPSNVKCTEDLQAVSEDLMTNTFWIPNALTSPRRTLDENSSKSLLLPPPTPEFRCRSYAHMLSYYWANDARVQKALNVRMGTVDEWIRCNHDIPYTYVIKSSIPYHRRLSKKNYHTLIYSGDHDYVVPHLSSQEWIRSLNYAVVDEWRPWFVDGQVAGYKRSYSNNMTFATVKGIMHGPRSSEYAMENDQYESIRAFH